MRLNKSLSVTETIEHPLNILPTLAQSQTLWTNFLEIPVGLLKFYGTARHKTPQPQNPQIGPNKNEFT